jgi:hypothetical protein
MIMIKNISIFILFTIVLNACITSVSMQEADRYYKQGEYAVADKLYSESEQKVPDATRKRAKCKYKMRDLQGAVLLYQNSDKTNFEPEDWKNFMDALNQIGRGAEVEAMMLQSGVNNDSLKVAVNRVFPNVSSATVKDMAWNPNGYAFSPTVVGDRTYYVGNDRKVKHYQDIYEGDHSSYLDIRSINPDLSKKTPIPLHWINSGQHEGPFTVNASANKIVFTRNSTESVIKKDAGAGYPQLYIMERIQGKIFKNRWSKAKKLSFCTEKAAYMHPVFNSDATQLYFSSNKSEGNGYDIFVSSIDSSGNWSEPVPVPDGVNTSGNEVFPTLVDDVLYFSSDARAGMGGLDVFGYHLTTKKIFWPAAPINSRRDDFGLVKAGFSNSMWYVSSNRLTSDGKDNVLKLEFLPGTFAKVKFVLSDTADKAVLSYRKVTVKSSVINDDRGKKYDLNRDAEIFINVDSTLNFSIDSFEVANMSQFEKLPLPFMAGYVEIALKRNTWAEGKGPQDSTAVANNGGKGGVDGQEGANGAGGKNGDKNGDKNGGNGKGPKGNIIIKDNGTLEEKVDDKFMNIRLVDEEFLIVAGAFRKTSKVDEFIKELQALGYSQAKRGGIHNGLSYVVYGSAKTREDAMTLLVDARKHNPDAWVKRQSLDMSKNDAVADILTASDIKPIEAIFISNELSDKSKYYVAMNKNNVVVVAKGFYGPRCLTDTDAQIIGKYIISPGKGLVVDFGDGLTRWKATVNKSGNVTQISGVLPGQTSTVVLQFLASLKGI